MKNYWTFSKVSPRFANGDKVWLNRDITICKVGSLLGKGWEYEDLPIGTLMVVTKPEEGEDRVRSWNMLSYEVELNDGRIIHYLPEIFLG